VKDSPHPHSPFELGLTKTNSDLPRAFHKFDVDEDYVMSQECTIRWRGCCYYWCLLSLNTINGSGSIDAGDSDGDDEGGRWQQ